MVNSGKWMSAAVECQACGYRWQTVFPAEMEFDLMDCPACQQFAGTIPTDEEYARWDGQIFASGDD